MDDLVALSNAEFFARKFFWIFGAGKNGIEFYRRIANSGYKIAGFCDNDERKCGKKINGTDEYCISVIELIKRYTVDKNIVIVITTHIEDISRQLIAAGVCDDCIFTDWAILHMIKYDIENKFFSEQFRDEWKSEEYVRDTCLRANYYAYHSTVNHIRTWRRIIEENPIVVYQFGKVGSSSIRDGIEHLGIPVEQTHAMAYVPSFMGNEMKDLYNLFQKHIEKKGLKIVSVVREPIARDISCLFEIMDVPSLKQFANMSPDYLQSIPWILSNGVCKEKTGVDDMTPLEYHYDYLLRGLNGDIFKWYEHEMQRVLAVDILQHEFSKKYGFGYINTRNIEILLMTFEKLKLNEQRIGAFIGNSKFSLISTNLADDKPYAYVYKNLKKKVVLPEAYISRYYPSNEYMAHFYAKKDIDEFEKKWMCD